VVVNGAGGVALRVDGREQVAAFVVLVTGDLAERVGGGLGDV